MCSPNNFPVWLASIWPAWVDPCLLMPVIKHGVVSANGLGILCCMRTWKTFEGVTNSKAEELGWETNVQVYIGMIEGAFKWPWSSQQRHGSNKRLKHSGSRWLICSCLGLKNVWKHEAVNVFTSHKVMLHANTPLMILSDDNKQWDCWSRLPRLTHFQHSCSGKILRKSIPALKKILLMLSIVKLFWIWLFKLHPRWVQ